VDDDGPISALGSLLIVYVRMSAEPGVYHRLSFRFCVLTRSSTPLFRGGRTEWDTDLIFKKPVTRGDLDAYMLAGLNDPAVMKALKAFDPTRRLEKQTSEHVRVMSAFANVTKVPFHWL
jgi:hypothetical protein